MDPRGLLGGGAGGSAMAVAAGACLVPLITCKEDRVVVVVGSELIKLMKVQSLLSLCILLVLVVMVFVMLLK
jgi:hypothetical protein